MGQVDRAGAEREMKIGRAAFVIVEVDVLETRTVRREDLVGGVEFREQIAMADIEMQADLRQGIEEFAQLPRVVKRTRNIFDHNTDPAVAPGVDEFAEAEEISFDDETAFVHGSVAIRMNVHPFHAEPGEGFQAVFEFLDRGTAK